MVMLFRLFNCKSHSKGGLHVTCRLLKQSHLLMPQNPGKGDALSKEQALLHPFVAGQKYGVGLDATRCFVFWKSN